MKNMKNKNKIKWDNLSSLKCECRSSFLKLRKRVNLCEKTIEVPRKWITENVMVQ